MQPASERRPPQSTHGRNQASRAWHLSAPCTDRPCVRVVQPLRRRGVNHVRSDLSEIAAAAEVDPKVRARVRATFRGSQQSPKKIDHLDLYTYAVARRRRPIAHGLALDFARRSHIYIYNTRAHRSAHILQPQGLHTTHTRLCRLTQSCAAAHRAAAFPAPLTGRRGRPWECGGPPSQAGRLTPAAAFNY